MGRDFNWEYKGRRFHGQQWEPPVIYGAMVLVHGIGENISRYSHVGDFFASQGYYVAGIDHYGHGRSDGRRGDALSLEDTLDYIGAFTEKIREEVRMPMCMYGHSMGGGLLAGFLLRRQPDLRAAVLSAPALIVGAAPGAFLRTVLHAGATLFPRWRFPTGLDIRKISHDPDVVKKFEHDPLRYDKASLHLMDLMVRNGRWCIRHAGELRTPTLLIHGTADEFTDPSGSGQFAGRAPAGLVTYQPWDKGYHELHNEPNRLEVLNFVAGWLSHIKKAP
ncbi:alpha/beta hydrolase [Chitinophaga lutea]